MRKILSLKSRHFLDIIEVTRNQDVDPQAGEKRAKKNESKNHKKGKNK